MWERFDAIFGNRIQELMRLPSLYSGVACHVGEPICLQGTS